MKLLCLMILLALPKSWMLVQNGSRTNKDFDDNWIMFITYQQSNITSRDVHFNNTMNIASWVYYFTRLGMTTPSIFGCRLCRSVYTNSFYQLSRNQDIPKFVGHVLAEKHEQVKGRLRGKLGTDD